MDLFNDLILTGLLAVPVMLCAAALLPPLRYVAQCLAAQAGDAIADYHFAWTVRTAQRDEQRSRREAEQEFAAWLSSRLGGEAATGVDDDLLHAQELMPAIRLLIQEEIPAAIRLCNGIHRKMALLSGAVHMQEIALEPECLASRRWTVILLANTQRMLHEYPLRLRLEADELIHALMVLRHSLVPTCARCPYIKRTVLAAGEQCSAAELIQIDPGGIHA